MDANPPDKADILSASGFMNQSVYIDQEYVLQVNAAGIIVALTRKSQSPHMRET
jgi:hypothetical protein